VVVEIDEAWANAASVLAGAGGRWWALVGTDRWASATCGPRVADQGEHRPCGQPSHLAAEPL